MKTIISTTTAPKAIGPYSQAVRAGSYVFFSGQIPLDPISGDVVGSDATAQTTQVLTNVKNVLEAAGLTFHHVVKTTVFLSDMNNFGAMNEVYQQYFTENCPARSTIQVARLPKDALVEIEVIAYSGE